MKTAPNGWLSRRRRSLIALAVIGLAVVLLYRWHDQRQRMAIVLEWGRLAPFPGSAHDVRLDTEGSMFTRAFRAHFLAPKDDVTLGWLRRRDHINPEHRIAV